MILNILNYITTNLIFFTGTYSNNVFPEQLPEDLELEYIKKAKNGDMDARNKLIEHNLRLVAHIVKKFEATGHDVDDLIGIGTVGLIKGIDTYSENKKVKLATYAAKCGLEIKNEQLLSPFIEKGITIENNHIIISNDQVNTIAQNVSVPVMEFVIKDTLKIDNVETSVLEYINHTGAEDATGDVKIPIEQVNWSPKTKEVQQIPLNVNEQFYFSIQGSSTTRYKSKNFTFGLQSTDASVTNGLLFSPNYNPENTNTFLPEQRFTLKADMTDSSHSNNTSIGAFINTVCGTDNTNMPNYSDSGVNVTKHIRQCLEGFPILLLLTVKSKTESGDNFSLADLEALRKCIIHNDDDIVDIKYSVSAFYDNRDQVYCFSCMIIVKN